MVKYSIHSQLQSLLQNKTSLIEEWFHAEYKKIEPLFYTSVDIRDSGYKIVPVDTNIFPAGFNNVHHSKYEQIAEQINAVLSKYTQSYNILIVPENITRNKAYLENIKALQQLIELSGRKVKIADINNNLVVDNGKLISKEGFVPDIIILNNDLTISVPKILQNIKQPIIPNIKSGWHIRNKSRHFESYASIVSKFCKAFDLDPFFLTSMFSNCDKVNFKESVGLDCIANDVEKMIYHLKTKYKEYQIKDNPYVFVKAENGTFGMGIMTVANGDEVYAMNRKLRKKMHIIKEGKINSKVIIQEGIRTSLTYNNCPAEVMSYLIGGNVAESFLRFNEARDSYNNLNKSGAEFVSLSKSDVIIEELANYHLVARLSSLAAALE